VPGSSALRRGRPISLAGMISTAGRRSPPGALMTVGVQPVLHYRLALSLEGSELCGTTIRRSGQRTMRRSSSAFEPTSKRRRGYPSETRVKRGKRIVHYDKELAEKLGKEDLCPCGSARRFQAVLSQQW
jgi:hypothetical protein